MTEFEDRQLIRELVQNWVLWRDSRMWERFRTVWHDDGVMMATWSQGTADEFIARSQAAFDNGIRILHELGGTTVDVRGERAIAHPDDHSSTRAGAWRYVRCRLHRPLL